jgi:glycine cleavage system aminomethyltransferase T
MERPAEWESRWWSPIINAEHLALREGAGLVDLSAFTVLDVAGPGALAGLQNLAVAQLDVPVGKVVYTSFLNEAGRFAADLTIMRLGSRAFRVVTGAADGARDAKWVSDHLPADAQLADVTSG